MGSTWVRIFFLNQVCFLLVKYVHADGSRGTSSSVSPALNPDCSQLEPPPCINTYSTDPETGAATFDYYLETCPKHECTLINPVDAPQTLPLATKAKITSNGTIPQAPRGELPKFRGQEKMPSQFMSDVQLPSYTVDKEGKFIRSGASWFCHTRNVGYTARVETGTTYGNPGEKEDAWAYCQFSRAYDLVELGGDYSLERYGGDYCTSAYRIYLCAIAFPKCQPATGGLSPTGTADIYGPDTLSLLEQANLMYTITKPCRTLCYNLLRTCDQQLQFSCHRKESRDWADYPGCNVAGNPGGGKLII